MTFPQPTPRISAHRQSHLVSAIATAVAISSSWITVDTAYGTGKLDPAIAYAHSATPALPTSRVFSSGVWGSALATSTLTSNVAWEIVRNSPVASGTYQRALVTLANDASLSVALYSAGAWGSNATLTTGAGTANTRVFAADYEGTTGNLMVAYRKGAGTTIYYRTYTTGSPSESSFSLGLAAAPTWMEIASKPGANEQVIVVAAGANLYAGVWNGSSWGNSTTLETALPTSGRPFHVVYTRLSGKAIVVWTATTGAPKYATWNGTSWSSSSSLPAIAGGVPCGWITLAPSPSKSSDEALVGCIGTNNQINVNNWTGSAWGTNLVVETTAYANTQPRVAIAYQPDAASALVAWHKSGATTVYYRTWASSAWSSQSTGPDMTTDTQTLRLAPGLNSTEIMMLSRRKGVVSYADYTVYSQNSTVTTTGTIINGLSGGSAGYNLPTPPSGTAGSTDITAAGTYAPGTYRDLNISGSQTINFSTGTYVFRSWTSAGLDTFNFDTSAGPVNVIVTTGGVNLNKVEFLTNTGSGQVNIHVNAGNFAVLGNSTFTDINILVYSGTASVGKAPSGTLGLYASGAIAFLNTGSVSMNTVGYNGTAALSTVLWTAGSPGARNDVVATVVSPGVGDPCSLAGTPTAGSPIITSWIQTAP